MVELYPSRSSIIEGAGGALASPGNVPAVDTEKSQHKSRFQGAVYAF